MARARLLVSLVTLATALLSAWVALWLTLLEQRRLPCDDVASLVAAHEVAAATSAVTVDLRVRLHCVVTSDSAELLGTGDRVEWSQTILAASSLGRNAAAQFETGDCVRIPNATTASLNVDTEAVLRGALHSAETAHIGEHGRSDGGIDLFLVPSGGGGGGSADDSVELTVAASGDTMWVRGLPVNEPSAAFAASIGAAVVSAVIAAIDPIAGGPSAAGDDIASPLAHASALAQRPRRAVDTAAPHSSTRCGAATSGATAQQHRNLAPESLHVEVALLEAEPRFSAASDDVGWRIAAAPAAADRVALVAASVADVAHVTTGSRRAWYGALGDEDAIVEAAARRAGPSEHGAAVAAAQRVVGGSAARAGYRDRVGLSGETTTEITAETGRVSLRDGDADAGAEPATQREQDTDQQRTAGRPLRLIHTAAAPLPLPPRHRVHIMESWSMSLLLATADADIAGGARGVEADVGGHAAAAAARIVFVDGSSEDSQRAPGGAKTAPLAQLEAGEDCICRYIADLRDDDDAGRPRAATFRDAAYASDSSCDNDINNNSSGGAGSGIRECSAGTHPAASLTDAARRRGAVDAGLGRTGFEVAANIRNAAVSAAASVRRHLFGTSAEDVAWPACGPHAAVQCTCAGAAAAPRRACVIGGSDGSTTTVWALGYVPPLAYSPLYLRDAALAAAHGDRLKREGAARPRVGLAAAAPVPMPCDSVGGLWVVSALTSAPLPSAHTDAARATEAARNALNPAAVTTAADETSHPSATAAAAAGCTLVPSMSIAGWGRIVIMNNVDAAETAAAPRASDQSGSSDGAGCGGTCGGGGRLGDRLGDEAVIALRMALGLPPRAVDRFVISVESGQGGAAVVGAGAAASANVHDGHAVATGAGAGTAEAIAVDATGGMGAEPRVVRVGGLRESRTAVVRTTLLRTPPTTADPHGDVPSRLELRALRRRAWGRHLHAALATLATACDVFGPAEHRAVGAAGAAWRSYRVTRRDVAAMRSALAAVDAAVAAAIMGDLRASLAELRRARLLSGMLLRAADAPAPDAFLPLTHAAAIYAPPWAPLALPLLFAVGGASATLWARRGVRRALAATSS